MLTLDKRILQKYTLFVRIFPQPIIFEWNKGNIKKNYEKHSVTNQEAEELFSNEPFMISEDTKHSTKKEQRFQAL
ncbi:BrnT family toxin, partial [Patescibacteria group bacterium]|nr:BrnT family toxin [Patescibacteria group bacterium]